MFALIRELVAPVVVRWLVGIAAALVAVGVAVGVVIRRVRCWVGLTCKVEHERDEGWKRVWRCKHCGRRFQSWYTI